jgi:hypothetical protein
MWVERQWDAPDPSPPMADISPVPPCSSHALAPGRWETALEYDSITESALDEVARILATAYIRYSRVKQVPKDGSCALGLACRPPESVHVQLTAGDDRE